jgi:hypothetical protein
LQAECDRLDFDTQCQYGTALNMSWRSVSWRRAGPLAQCVLLRSTVCSAGCSLIEPYHLLLLACVVLKCGLHKRPWPSLLPGTSVVLCGFVLAQC